MVPARDIFGLKKGMQGFVLNVQWLGIHSSVMLTVFVLIERKLN